MSVELAVLVSTVGAIATTFGSIVNVIKGTLERKGKVSEEDIRELEKRVNVLSEQISTVGELSDILENYVKLFVGTIETYTACDKLVDFFSSNLKALGETENPSHEVLWSSVERLVGIVDREKASNIQVVLNQMDYLDEGDATAIRLLVNGFNSEYTYVVAEKNAKRPDRVKEHAEAMRKASGDIREVLEKTVFGVIIRNLSRIGG